MNRRVIDKHHKDQIKVQGWKVKLTELFCGATPEKLRVKTTPRFVFNLSRNTESFVLVHFLTSYSSHNNSGCVLVATFSIVFFANNVNEDALSSSVSDFITFSFTLNERFCFALYIWRGCYDCVHVFRMYCRKCRWFITPNTVKIRFDVWCVADIYNQLNFS